MSHKPRIVIGIIAFCIAQGVLVLGLALLLGAVGSNEHFAAALALIAAGMLLVMTCVIDPLVPDAGRLFTSAIKLATLVVLLVGTSHTLYGVITGQYDLAGLS